MRFLVHGAIDAKARAAMVRHEQMCHGMEELSEEEAGAARDGPEGLCGVLTKRQWNLLTTDTDLVGKLYEQKAAFGGVIVLILEGAQDQSGAVDRLFERYARLTPRRMYTVTGSRVKVRQLPGAGQG